MSQGVYKVTIDSQKQKVTVAGNVEADTLIRKLLKMGKSAELWPEKKPAGGDVQGNSGDKCAGAGSPAQENIDGEESWKLSSTGDVKKEGKKTIPGTGVKQGTVCRSYLSAPEYNFPASSNQPPAYILSNAGVAHHEVRLHQTTFDLFSEENANACTVM